MVPSSEKGQEPGTEFIDVVRETKDDHGRPTEDSVASSDRNHHTGLPKTVAVGLGAVGSTPLDAVGSKERLDGPATFQQPPPDGGRTAWTQAAMGHLVMFNTWGFISSFGLFQTYYSSDLLSTSSESNISWIGSVQCFLVFSVGLISGRALDTGYFHHTYLAGCFLLNVGIMMTSLCQTYWQVFLAQGLCVGLGTGLMFTPSIGLVSTYFSHWRTFALAIFLCGAGTGGMIIPAMFTSLLPGIGFGWTVRVIGFLVMASSATTLAMFKPRKISATKIPPLFDREALLDPVFVYFTSGMWLIFLALYFAFFFIGTFAREVVGLSYSSSVNMLIALNGIGIPGRLIPALIATRYVGAINTLIVATAVSAVCLYAWAAVEDTLGLYFFAALYGFFSSALQGLWPAALANLTEEMSMIGSRMGLAFAIISIALISGPPIGGALVRLGQDGWLYSQVWAGSAFVCGAVLVVLARLRKTGRKLRVKI